jgi:hypothetical protein
MVFGLAGTYGEAMSEFLVEAYLPRGAGQLGVPSAEQLFQTAEELAAKGTSVRLVRSIFVPEEETCFHLYQADSIQAVAQAAALAGLSFERITEAVSEGAPRSGGPRQRSNGGKQDA